MRLRRENLFFKGLYNIYVFHFCKCFYRKFKRSAKYFPLFSFIRKLLPVIAKKLLVIFFTFGILQEIFLPPNRIFRQKPHYKRKGTLTAKGPYNICVCHFCKWISRRILKSVTEKILSLFLQKMSHYNFFTCNMR